jgi:hypothetical protein
MVVGEGGEGEAAASGGEESRRASMGDGQSGDWRSEVAASLPALPEVQPLSDGRSGDLRSQGQAGDWRSETVAAAVMPSLGVESLGTVRVGGGGRLGDLRSQGQSGDGRSNGASGGGDGDEPLGLFRGEGGGGGSGSGSGGGRGRGGGIDRGALFAFVQPQFLGFSREAPELLMPAKCREALAKKAVRLMVTIGADGTIEGVRVEESCGVTEADEMCREYMAANGRFSPARKDGKAVGTEIAFSFGKVD